MLWAVVVGALMKFVLNEGLTRWQLATGTTLMEGCVAHLGKPASWLFLAYLLVWSFFVAAALMSAVGVTAHAILPLAGSGPDAAGTDKVIYGVAHSIVAVILVRRGGYRLFEKVMSVCIAIMFVTVVAAAVALQPSLADVCRGLLVPTVPDLHGGGAAWTVALIGGVGGTVTVLCYGYWIREEGRQGAEELRACRLDLATGYIMTGFFGVAMVIIGSSLGRLQGGGATLIVDMARQLETTLGGAGTYLKWAFLAGAWARCSAACWACGKACPTCSPICGSTCAAARARWRWSIPIRSPIADTCMALAAIPVAGMALGNFQGLQKLYAIVGAVFVPMLAAALLVLNGARPGWASTATRGSRY